MSAIAGVVDPRALASSPANRGGIGTGPGGRPCSPGKEADTSIATPRALLRKFLTTEPRRYDAASLLERTATRVVGSALRFFGGSSGYSSSAVVPTINGAASSAEAQAEAETSLAAAVEGSIHLEISCLPLFEERVELLHALGRHGEAVLVLLYELGDVRAAERYCLWEEQRAAAAANTGRADLSAASNLLGAGSPGYDRASSSLATRGRFRRHTRPYGTRAGGGSSLLLMLVRLLLYCDRPALVAAARRTLRGAKATSEGSGPGRESLEQRAEDLAKRTSLRWRRAAFTVLQRNAARLDPVAVLDLVPADTKLSELVAPSKKRRPKRTGGLLSLLNDFMLFVLPD